MTVFETNFLMISFGTLIVAILSHQKNNHPMSLG